MFDKLSNITKSEFIDFSSYEADTSYDLGGVTPKVIVIHNDDKYMLKFAKEKHELKVCDYITEYIASRLAKCLGYNAQDVYLGHYNGLECVAIKLVDYELVTFTGFGSSTDSEDFYYDLDLLLKLPFKKSKFAITVEEFECYVWSVFALDLFIGNFDRHENNWAFRRNNEGLYEPAILYDMGASFYPKLMFDCKMDIKSIKHLIQYDSRCSILYNGKKKNYFELVDIYQDNKQMHNAIVDILNKYNEEYLFNILDSVVRYNSEYEEYCDFVRQLMSIKVDMIKELIGS